MAGLSESGAAGALPIPAGPAQPEGHLIGGGIFFNLNLNPYRTDSVTLSLRGGQNEILRHFWELSL